MATGIYKVEAGIRRGEGGIRTVVKVGTNIVDGNAHYRWFIGDALTTYV